MPAASFAAFAGWSLLLPVIPMAVARDGGTAVQAGATTTAFMAATVVAQILVAPMLRRWGYRVVLIAGCLLLALPCTLMMLPTPLIWWYGIAVLRGFGFGLLTVATTALVGRLAPQQTWGRATGVKGAVIGCATTISLPGGLAVADNAGMGVALAIGALLPVLALIGLLRIPPLREPSTRPVDTIPSLEKRWVLTSSIVMTLTGAAFGCVTTLVPIGVSAGSYDAKLLLLLIGALSMAGRYGAGLCVDRCGPGRVLVLSLVIGTASLCALGTGLNSSTLWLLAVAAAAFGLAYGVVQTETIVLTYVVAGTSGVALASTYDWLYRRLPNYNIGVDMGIDIGSLTQGAAAELVGVPIALASSGIFTTTAILPAAMAIRHLRTRNTSRR
ncbi:MFS transporter [Mycolicibacterium sp. YH-1]|uniref:MFS transporter n=1 Tax=Mycolicibacterium sp. YH-1 TaxID=2908837 RepID=UPI001F4C4319|nr:MFS transporter [Mycolicibacterium sp. YH-1]UNB50810.1 MFS transporter [Mycolicibacterium sp. YH-1]